MDVPGSLVEHPCKYGRAHPGNGAALAGPGPTPAGRRASPLGLKTGGGAIPRLAGRGSRPGTWPARCPPGRMVPRLRSRPMGEPPGTAASPGAGADGAGGSATTAAWSCRSRSLRARRSPAAWAASRSLRVSLEEDRASAWGCSLRAGRASARSWREETGPGLVLAFGAGGAFGTGLAAGAVLPFGPGRSLGPGSGPLGAGRLGRALGAGCGPLLGFLAAPGLGLPGRLALFLARLGRGFGDGLPGFPGRGLGRRGRNRGLGGLDRGGLGRGGLGRRLLPGDVPAAEALPDLLGLGRTWRWT